MVYSYLHNNNMPNIIFVDCRLACVVTTTRIIRQNVDNGRHLLHQHLEKVDLLTAAAVFYIRGSVVNYNI